MGETAGAAWERMSVGAEGASREGVLTGPVQSGGGWATGVWGRGIKQWGLRQKCRKRVPGGFALLRVLDALRSLGRTHRKPRAQARSGCVLVRGGGWEAVLKVGEGCWVLPPKVHVLIV